MHKNDKSRKALEIISHPGTAKTEAKEATDDALSVIVDALNSSIAALIITDLKGIILYANPAFCKMFEYALREIIGKDSAELFSSRQINKIIDVLSIIDHSQSSTEEFTVEKKDGRSFIVEVSASSVTSVSGERIGRMASFVDITKRKILEVNLEKKLKDTLDQLKILRGILPICTSCKRIRDSNGRWNQLEIYIKEHSQANFSHGICPDCAKDLYPKFNK